MHSASIQIFNLISLRVNTGAAIYLLEEKKILEFFFCKLLYDQKREIDEAGSIIQKIKMMFKNKQINKEY